jgi:hypothetical protein
VTGWMTMWGQPVTVMFEERDLSLFPTQNTVSASASVSASATASAGVSPASVTAMPTESGVGVPGVSAIAASASSSPSGLSAAASAGIGVGATFGTLALVSLGVLVWWRRRRSRLEGSHLAAEKDTESSLAEMGSAQWSEDGVVKEPEVLNEVDATPVRYELDGFGHKTELDSASRIREMNA